MAPSRLVVIVLLLGFMISSISMTVRRISFILGNTPVYTSYWSCGKRGLARSAIFFLELFILLKMHKSNYAFERLQYNEASRELKYPSVLGSKEVKDFTEINNTKIIS